MENLGHQIVTPQGHVEQKLDACHRLVSGADADAALDQMLLEILHIVWRGRLWRAPYRPSLNTRSLARTHLINPTGGVTN
jgi:hypothetical protein